MSSDPVTFVLFAIIGMCVAVGGLGVLIASYGDGTGWVLIAVTGTALLACVAILVARRRRR